METTFSWLVFVLPNKDLDHPLYPRPPVTSDKVDGHYLVGLVPRPSLPSLEFTVSVDDKNGSKSSKRNYLQGVKLTGK